VREPESITVHPRFSTSPRRIENLRPANLPILGSLDRVIHWLEETDEPTDEAVVKRLAKLRELLERHAVAS
jgi:hypothetical protein